MRHLKFVVNCALVFASIGAFAQESARTVQYHSQDIVPIRAKVKYTTLIELPTTEKIMEAATGDKEFWIVDVVGEEDLCRATLRHYRQHPRFLKLFDGLRRQDHRGVVLAPGLLLSLIHI